QYIHSVGESKSRCLPPSPTEWYDGTPTAAMRSPGPHGLLNGASDRRRGEGLGQSGHAALGYESEDLGAQGIPGKENEALAQMRIMDLQCPVEPWPVQLRHAQVAQDQVIGPFLEHGQRQPAVGRDLPGVAVAAREA